MRIDKKTLLTITWILLFGCASSAYSQSQISLDYEWSWAINTENVTITDFFTDSSSTLLIGESYSSVTFDEYELVYDGLHQFYIKLNESGEIESAELICNSISSNQIIIKDESVVLSGRLLPGEQLEFFGDTLVNTGDVSTIILARKDLTSGHVWMKHIAQEKKTETDENWREPHIYPKQIEVNDEGDIYLMGTVLTSGIFEGTPITTTGGFIRVFIASYTSDGSRNYIRKIIEDHPTGDEARPQMAIGPNSELITSFMFDDFARLENGQGIYPTDFFAYLICKFDDTGHLVWHQTAQSFNYNSPAETNDLYVAPTGDVFFSINTGYTTGADETIQIDGQSFTSTRYPSEDEKILIKLSADDGSVMWGENLGIFNVYGSSNTKISVAMDTVVYFQHFRKHLSINELIAFNMETGDSIPVDSQNDEITTTNGLTSISPLGEFFLFGDVLAEVQVPTSSELKSGNMILKGSQLMKFNSMATTTQTPIIDNVTTDTPFIYPNPFSNSINLTGNVKQGSTYQLIDIQGNLLQTGLPDDLTLTSIKSGTYFLQLFDTNGSLTGIQKISKVN